MKFSVQGADSKSARDVELEVEAANQKEAEAIVAGMGVYVSASEPVRPPVSRARGVLRNRWVLLGASAAIVLIPTLIWWMNVKDSLFTSRRTSPEADSIAANRSSDSIVTPRAAGSASSGADAADSKGTRWNGKTLKEWGAQLTSGDVEQRRDAAQALHRIELPSRDDLAGICGYLRNAMRDSDSGVRAIAAGRLATLGTPGTDILISLLEEGGDVGLEAATTFGRVPKPDNDLVSKLIGLFSARNDRTSTYATVALGGIGRPAVPQLINALSDPSPRIRAAALLSLGSMGAKAADAIPAIRNRLQDEHSKIRQLAADTLVSVAGRGGNR